MAEVDTNEKTLSPSTRDVLGVDFSGIKTSAQARSKQAELLPQATKAKLELEQREAIEKKRIAEDVFQKRAAAAKADTEPYEKQLRELPHPEFHPTEDNIESLGKVASLISVIGVMLGSSGKLGSIRALNAMSGMMQGYRQGRADLVAREKQKYDTEVSQFERRHRQLKELVESAQKNFATNRPLALEELEIASRLAGSDSLLGLKLKAGNFTDALNILASTEKSLLEKEKLIQQAAERHQERMGELAYQRETALQVAGMKGAKQGYQSVLLAGRAENIREAFVQVSKDIENIAKFPPGTVLGTFSGMTGQEGSTIASSLSNTFARKISSDESRMLQQLMSGLESNMAMALGGGYAASASKNRIDMYKTQVPKQGDSGYVAANFLARIKQEMNVLADNFPSKPGATPEMTQKVQAANQAINKSVPFDVADVTSALYAGTAPPTNKASGGKISVTDPEGGVHEFDTQEQADSFKKSAGIQ